MTVTLPSIRQFVQTNGGRLKGVAAIAIVVVVALGLHLLLQTLRLHDVRNAFHAIDAERLWGAITLTVISYWMLTYYDVLALQIIGKPLPYAKAALASFTNYTLSHNLGLGIVTGGSARLRIYSAAGLSVGDVLRVIAIASATFWTGVALVASLAMILQPMSLRLLGVDLSASMQHGIGILLLLTVILGIGLVVRGAIPGLRHLRLPRATTGQVAKLLAVSVADLAAATAALAILLPSMNVGMFGHFYLAYAVAIIVTLVTHVPGGLGVFEAVIIASFPADDRAQLVAALLVYRLVYYLLPLLVAAAIVVAMENRRLHAPVSRAIGITRSVFGEIAPPLMAALSFGGGVVLLVSGSLPAKTWRLDMIRDILPLPFVEASHLAASLSGAGLLLLAPGLYRRLDGACMLTKLLLVAGAAFSLLKGFDFEEATVLLAIAGLLHLSSHAFYRRTVLTTDVWTPQWLVAIGTVIILTSWIGFFAYKHVDYSDALWWQFGWHGDASRFLRASVAVALLFTVLAYRRLVSGVGARTIPDLEGNFDPAAILAKANRTDALLALTGDKRFLASEEGDAFLMYQVQGHSWIVMGDPVGPEERWPDLLWRIREMADAAQGRLLLYQITVDMLPHTIDLGMQVVKYGEEAQVDLARFTLEGSAMRSLRHCVRRAEREGVEFELVAAGDVPVLLPELRAISDTWLKAKSGSEKAFSVGRFDPVYMARFDCALIRSEGRIVAFANVWRSGDGSELSVDLMRHSDTLPYGTMDLLFTRLMLWGKDRGCASFNLGIAPLSGLEARRLAPLWSKAGALLYRHGDAFYGFEGLRGYKEKFVPSWSPRYVGAPQGLGLVRALIDLQTLIGGGSGSAARRASIRLAA